ncbi:MAG TPA: helicase-related protein [Verrucomicrobiae bacterium]|nr:helicase-related protein [Verrucomicrobiae bacterium]
MSSDLTFITNEAGQNLRDRFGVLLGEDTRFFDCLVGYFYISGFYKLYPSLTKTEKIRILIGIKTDGKTYELIQEAKQQELVLESHAQARAAVAGAVHGELEKSEDSASIEEGVRKFVEWITSGKLEVKAFPSERIHAKLYIMTFHEDDRDKGRVITGSSNFTEAGLLENLEFNVELKNRSDYDFALAKFNELWAKGVEVSKDFVQIIEKESPYAQFTPHELYLKFLYEYFRNELNQPDELDDSYLPTDFKKLKYQEDAVLNAARVLDEFKGVFLADVVGLGKTFMSALLARHLDGRSIVIAPPHLLDKHNPGSWPNVFRDFGVRGAEFESIGKLASLLEREDLENYQYVFIDESHRFRTEDTQSYELLAQICSGKKVVLVSATPLNNSPQDILSQIKLFQPAKNSTIPGVRNLEAFFAGLRRNLSGLDRQDDREQYFQIVQDNARATREKILKHLMIRRTRNEIKEFYGDDLAKQGLKFPEVADPEPLFYKLDENENRIFDETVRLLTLEFKYARYKPLEYFEGEHTKQEVQSQVNLAKFMKILTVKRLESSFTAFRQTLGRFIATYERVIEEFGKGQVFISKKHIAKVFELLESDDTEALQRLIDEDKAEKLNASNFKPNFIADLKSDLKILHTIRDHWRKITRDPKWEEFASVLKTKAHLKKGKIIIFTESKETAKYLAAQIAQEVDPKVLVFTGMSHESIRAEVISNFDAKVRHPKDDYRILVATEVLAEGVNLHRSHVVINYDIPWNPTRLIQRVGRVNRVDTKFEKIYTFNFFPTTKSNDIIKLREAAEAKIHAFIEMLGADAKLLTDGEDIKSQSLFSRLNSKETITGENADEESELKYLSEIREVRDKNPDLFEQVKRLPKKARSTRLLPTVVSAKQLPALLTYFRRDKLDKFFLAPPASSEAAEIDFFTAAKILKPTDSQEPRQNIPSGFYNLLDQNKQNFLTVTTTETEYAETAHRGDRVAATVLKRLRAKEVRRCQQFTDDDEEFIGKVIRLLEDGSLPKRTTQKIADSIKTELQPLNILRILRRCVPREFLRTNRMQIGQTHAAREVILSSFLIPSGEFEFAIFTLKFCKPDDAPFSEADKRLCVEEGKEALKKLFVGFLADSEAQIEVRCVAQGEGTFWEDLAIVVGVVAASGPILHLLGLGLEKWGRGYEPSPVLPLVKTGKWLQGVAWRLTPQPGNPDSEKLPMCFGIKRWLDRRTKRCKTCQVLSQCVQKIEGLA